MLGRLIASALGGGFVAGGAVARLVRGLVQRLARASAGRAHRLFRRAPPSAVRSPAHSPAPDFPPMRPLRPPAARNDDVLRPVHEAVERDLRARGYLR